jgi:hypothetical protein
MNVFERIYKKLFTLKYYEKIITEMENEYKIKFRNALPEEKDQYIFEERTEIDMLCDDRNDIKSKKWLRIARKYNLLFPTKNNDDKLNENWINSYDGTQYLSSIGIDKIKKEYRETLKWKQDRFISYTSIIITFMSLMVAILSLISTKK